MSPPKKRRGEEIPFFSRIWELVFIARRRLSSGGLPASSSLVACRLRACPFSRQGGKILYPSRCRTTYCSSRGHHFRPPPFPPSSRVLFALQHPFLLPPAPDPPLAFALLFHPPHHGGGGKEPRFLSPSCAADLVSTYTFSVRCKKDGGCKCTVQYSPFPFPFPSSSRRFACCSKEQFLPIFPPREEVEKEISEFSDRFRLILLLLLLGLGQRPIYTDEGGGGGEGKLPTLKLIGHLSRRRLRRRGSEREKEGVSRCGFGRPSLKIQLQVASDVCFRMGESQSSSFCVIGAKPGLVVHCPSPSSPFESNPRQRKTKQAVSFSLFPQPQKPPSLFSSEVGGGDCGSNRPD